MQMRPMRIRLRRSINDRAHRALSTARSIRERPSASGTAASTPSIRAPRRLLLNLSTSGGSTNFRVHALHVPEVIAGAALRDQCGQHRVNGHHHVPGGGPAHHLAALTLPDSPDELVLQPKIGRPPKRLREYLSSLDNDLARYVQIFTLETADAEPPSWTFSTACPQRKKSSLRTSLWPTGLRMR
jgi:hypothetical protein